MSAPQHTPGPWRVVEYPEQGTANGRRITVQARGCIVVDVDWNTPGENRANAALIASAPALAAECERLRAERDALRAQVDVFKAVVQAIDNIAHDTPCMSLQASHEFERCAAAEAHRVASNHVLLAIRRETRGALNQ